MQKIFGLCAMIWPTLFGCGDGTMQGSDFFSDSQKLTGPYQCSYSQSIWGSGVDCGSGKSCIRAFSTAEREKTCYGDSKASNSSACVLSVGDDGWLYDQGWCCGSEEDEHCRNQVSQSHESCKNDVSTCDQVKYSDATSPDSCNNSCEPAAISSNRPGCFWTYNPMQTDITGGFCDGGR